jgi:hypothetical protein
MSGGSKRSSKGGRSRKSGISTVGTPGAGASVGKPSVKTVWTARSWVQIEDVGLAWWWAIALGEAERVRRPGAIAGSVGIVGDRGGAKEKEGVVDVDEAIVGKAVAVEAVVGVGVVGVAIGVVGTGVGVTISVEGVGAAADCWKSLTMLLATLRSASRTKAQAVRAAHSNARSVGEMAAESVFLALLALLALALAWMPRKLVGAIIFGVCW